MYKTKDTSRLEALILEVLANLHVQARLTVIPTNEAIPVF